MMMVMAAVVVVLVVVLVMMTVMMFTMGMTMAVIMIVGSPVVVLDAVILVLTICRYKAVRGSSSRSYGLNVARLAGIPRDILKVAALRWSFW